MELVIRGDNRNISIHALLAESDAVTLFDREFMTIISIHALLAESDRADCTRTASSWHFYPRSPCGERQQAGRRKLQGGLISIHALLAESDLSLDAQAQLAQQFLSTLSLRRATTPSSSASKLHSNFYPRSPCGERHEASTPARAYTAISIHALLAESD